MTVEIQPSFAPNTKSGTSSTTGGTTISETKRESSASRPRKLQREKPQAASEARINVAATDAPVTMALFSNQRGNWSFSAVRKPFSVGCASGANGLLRKPPWVLKAAVTITQDGNIATNDASTST